MTVDLSLEVQGCEQFDFDFLGLVVLKLVQMVDPAGWNILAPTDELDFRIPWNGREFEPTVLIGRAFFELQYLCLLSKLSRSNHLPVKRKLSPSGRMAIAGDDQTQLSRCHGYAFHVHNSTAVT